MRQKQKQKAQSKNKLGNKIQKEDSPTKLLFVFGLDKLQSDCRSDSSLSFGYADLVQHSPPQQLCPVGDCSSEASGELKITHSSGLDNQIMLNYAVTV